MATQTGRRGTPNREVSPSRRPYVLVRDTAAPERWNPVEEYVRGRGYGKMLARQWAETYQAQGFQVDGTSAHGYTVSDRLGVRGRIDVVDVDGPFGTVTRTASEGR